MRALTLFQPLAWLLATGRSTMNTRHWSTDYRGKVAIHAASSVDEAEVAAYRAVGVQVPSNLPVRAFIGVVDLVDCRRARDCHADAQASSSSELDEAAVLRLYERTQVPWTGLEHPGLWALCFANATLISPVPARGEQLLWTPSNAQIEDLRAAWVAMRKSRS